MKPNELQVLLADGKEYMGIKKLIVLLIAKKLL